MRLPTYFDTLLRDTVNLNDTRLLQLGDRVDAIYAELKADAVLGPYVRGKKPQGSWAQRTIIKPLPGYEFDGDFLLELAENPLWSASPKLYIDQIYAALGRSHVYGAMPRTRKCRCVRVTYANDCHIDIVAYLILPGGREVIVHRDDDRWEDTNPDGFTHWMRTRDELAGGNLRRVIRLLKFLRDHKGTFRGTRSVLLTTMVGNCVDPVKAIAEPGYYADVPTTLLHLTGDLDAWLQQNPSKPSIADPSMPSTTFDHRWDQATYANFRDKMHNYATAISEAYYETSRDRSIELWRDIFGDGFGAPAPATSSGRFGTSPLIVPTRPGRAG